VKQIAPAVIGETWAISRGEKGPFTGGEHGPKRQGMVEKARILEYQALDLAAYQTMQEIKAERVLKNRRSYFDEALAPLHALVSSVRGHDERAAVIQRITSELWRGGPKK
jgi:hypothetical protein